MLVNDYTHKRVVDCVPHSGKEHEHKYKYVRQNKHVCVIVAYKARHCRIDHALTQAADRIHHKLFAGHDTFVFTHINTA